VNSNCISYLLVLVMVRQSSFCKRHLRYNICQSMLRNCCRECMCTKVCLVSNKQFLLAVDYAFLLGAQKYKASHGNINI